LLQASCLSNIPPPSCKTMLRNRPQMTCIWPPAHHCPVVCDRVMKGEEKELAEHAPVAAWWRLSTVLLLALLSSFGGCPCGIQVHQGKLQTGQSTKAGTGMWCCKLHVCPCMLLSNMAGPSHCPHTALVQTCLRHQMPGDTCLQTCLVDSIQHSNQ
jgi:hypothetical protein